MDEYTTLIGIDRDGTVIEDDGSFPGSKWPQETFALRPNVNDGLLFLRKHVPYARLALISNQSGPARGRVDPDHIPFVNGTIQNLLRVLLDDVQYCMLVTPKYADKNRAKGNYVDSTYVSDACTCKPHPGMLEQSCQKLFKRPAQDCIVYLIGDRPDDVRAGLRAGGKGIFIKSDVAEHSNLDEVIALQREHGKNRVYIASDFLDAAKWIVNDGREGWPFLQSLTRI